MKLETLEGEKVKILTTQGKTYEGLVTDYIYPEDNEPDGIESIIVKCKTQGRSIEFPEYDIKSIEVIP